MSNKYNRWNLPPTCYIRENTPYTIFSRENKAKYSLTNVCSVCGKPIKRDMFHGKYPSKCPHCKRKIIL